MAEDNMPGEIFRQGDIGGEREAALEIRNHVRGIQKQTLNLDRIDSKALGKTLRQKSTILFGHDYFGHEPHIFVIGPQLSSHNPDRIEKAKNALTSLGIRGIYQAERDGKISSNQAEELRVKMSLGRVGVLAPVQGENPFSFGQQHQPDLSENTLQKRTPTSREPSSLVWQIPNVIRDITPKQATKIGAIMVGNAVLVGCSVISPSATTETQTPVETISTENIPPLKENFGKTTLTGEIVDIKGEVDNQDVLAGKAEEALLKSRYAQELSGKQYVMWGVSLVDINGDTQPAVFVSVLDSSGQPVTPTPEPGPTINVEKPVLFFYTESDGITKLVPPGEGNEKAGGTVVPMRAWIENGKYFIGMATPIDGSYDLVPVFQVEFDKEGKPLVTYIDPYSGKKFVTKDINKFPVVAANVLASLASIEAPESAIPTELTPADLEKGKWGSYTFTENPAGYYEINGVPEAKFFKDGTSELAVKFNGKTEVATVAFPAISISKDGQLVLGLWEYVNSAWSEAKTNPAPKSVEETESFHKLAILQGHEKEQAMIDTIFLARDMAMTKSETYDPASEFQGITVTYNFKTVENFDVRPKKWDIQNWSRVYKGLFRLKAISPNSEVAYEDRGKNSNARPSQVALGSGWFNLEIYNPDGTQQPDAVHVPVIIMNPDRSLIDSSTLLRKNILPKIFHLLNKEDRSEISSIWIISQPIPPNAVDDNELISLMVRANKRYFETIGGPELDTDWPSKSLPEELGQVLLILFISPENLKQ